MLRNSMEQANNSIIYRWSPIWRTRTTKQVLLQCGVLWFTEAGKHHVLSPSCAQKETQWLTDSTQPRDPTRRVGCLSLSVIFFPKKEFFCLCIYMSSLCHYLIIFIKIKNIMKEVLSSSFFLYRMTSKLLFNLWDPFCI